MLLTSEHRKIAPVIYQTLLTCRELKSKMKIDEVKKFVIDSINRTILLKIEYFQIVDTKYLVPVKSWDQGDGVVACIAVWAGNVRLIDNIGL